MNLHPLLAQFPVGEPGGEDGPFFQLGLGDEFAGVDVKILCGREPLLPCRFVEHPGEEAPHEVVQIRRPLMADLGEAEPHPGLAQFAAFLKVKKGGVIAARIPFATGDETGRERSVRRTKVLPPTHSVTAPCEDSIGIGIDKGGGEAGSGGKAVEKERQVLRLGRPKIMVDAREEQASGGRVGVGIGVFDAVRRGGKRESTENQLMLVRESDPFLFDDEVAAVAVAAGGEDEDGLGADG